MAEFPALPLWTDAWIADTKHLTRCERGTYLDLLILMWRTPHCRVPNEKKWLCARLHLSSSVFDNELIPIIKDFCHTDGNWIFQRRLRKEFRYLQGQRRLQSDRAKSRWKKEKDNARAYATSGIAPTPTPTPIPIRGRGPDADSDSKTKSTHAPTRKAASGHPSKEARRSPRSPMPETWAPSEAGLQYATDAGIARAKFPYLIKRCRDYHIRNGTMIAGERGLAATWRTWCDQEAKFAAEKNGAEVGGDSVPHRGYRPEGWTDADERKLAARSATKIADVLDEGRPICDQDGNGLGNGRGRHG